VEAAKRGHKLTIYDAGSEIGGQFNLAKRVPGKEEFHETLRYFSRMIEKLGISLKLNTRVDADMLAAAGHDEVIVATGIRPRTPYVFFNSSYWSDLRRQLSAMVKSNRMPAWMMDYMLFTDDPDEVVAFYRKKLQVL
jgi:hypothetical protein